MTKEKWLQEKAEECKHSWEDIEDIDTLCIHCGMTLEYFKGLAKGREENKCEKHGNLYVFDCIRCVREPLEKRIEQARQEAFEEVRTIRLGLMKRFTLQDSALSALDSLGQELEALSKEEVK